MSDKSIYTLINFASAAPMALLICFALFIICISIFVKNLSRSFYAIVTLVAIILDIALVACYNSNTRGFFDIMLIDGIATLSMLIILVTSIFFLMLGLSKKIFHEYSMPEFFALFLFILAGYEFMVSSDNLILIFIGLETSSLALYAIIAMHNRNRSIEAALKYFTMGALASSFFAFGIAIFYLVCGSIEISLIAESIQKGGLKESIALTAAAAFMIAALGFKLSLIPFHTWIVDVYEGSSAPIAGFMSVVSKIAGFIVALRLFEALIHVDVMWIRDVLWIVAVMTMTLANIMALIQKDVKRMLAFSSISHAGFVLCAIVISTTQANAAIFLYWIMFAAANLGAFAILWLTRDKKSIWHERFDHPFEKFSGLIKISPTSATLMALFMLSLAGMPPFSLFWGKMYLMSAAVNGGFIYLSVIMALNSAIAVYYYLKLVIFMFLKEPITNDAKAYTVNESTTLKFIIFSAAFLCLIAPIIFKFIVPFILKFVTISGA